MHDDCQDHRSAGVLAQQRSESAPAASLAEAAATRIQALFTQAPGLAQTVASKHGSAAIEALSSDAPAQRYSELPPAVHTLLHALRADHGAAAAAAGPHWLLLQAIESFERHFARSGLPAPFRGEFARCLWRMLDEYGSADPAAEPLLTTDRFLKDLAIARLVLVPCASHVVHRHSGIPRRALARVRTVGSAWRVASVVLGKAGGLQPFLENHVHKAMLDEFSPQGRERCMRLVASLLLAWPDARGLMGTSWYYDPQVGRHSPRLAYLRDDAAARGACFIDMGVHPEATGSALSRSPTRRAAHAKGLYQPRNYMMIWSRQDILHHYAPAGAPV